MMGKWICQGSSSNCLRYFKDNIKNFGEVLKLTSYFESSNFLLTPYPVESSGIHTVLENEQGEIMQLAGLNCGYGGTGPSATAEVLVELGIAKTTAHRWKYNTGLQISFDKFPDESPDIRLNTSVFFEKRKLTNTDSIVSPCPLSDTTFVRIDEGVVYMVEPMKNNPAGFYNCLKIMRPIKVEYILNGSESESVMTAGKLINYHYGGIKNISEFSNLPMNIQIYGNQFSLFCFVKEEMLIELIQNTHRILCGTSFNDENFLSMPPLSQQTFSFFAKQAIKSICKTKNKPIKGSFDISIAGGSLND